MNNKKISPVFGPLSAAALALTLNITGASAAFAQECGRIVGYGDSQANRFALVTGNTSLAIDGKGLYTGALINNISHIRAGDNVFVSLGSNDIGYVMGQGNDALTQYKSDLNTRLQQILARQPRAVVVMIPSTGDYRYLNAQQEHFLNTVMADAVRDVATDLGLGVIETINKRRDDGIHLTFETMRQIERNEFADLINCPALRR